jgi:hypothetical protein
MVRPSRGSIWGCSPADRRSARCSTPVPRTIAPNFYLGYLGAAWDSDEFAFETRFWNALGPGLGVGKAFDVAKLGSFTVGFAANWYGSYLWTGRAGPLPSGCTKCL